MRSLRILAVLLVFGFSTGYAADPPPSQVVVAKISKKSTAQDQTYIGTLYYERTSQISSEISGSITRILVKEGQRVKKNAPLIVLDTELLEKEIAIHRNQIELAKLSITHLEKNFDRMAALYNKGSASERVYDEAQFAHQDALLKQLNTQTNLEKLLIKKAKSVIKAPFDGIVLDKKVDSGSWVSPGKSLVEIGSVHDLFIKVPISETDLKFLSFGEQVPVIINAYDKKVTGVIENLSPVADAKTKNVFLKVRIPSLKKVARNMSATVKISIKKEEELAMIPRDALIKFRGKDFVYTVKDNKAAILPINIVRYMGKQVGADNKNLVDGMPVVVDGNERLRPGQAVVVAGEK